MKTVSTLVLFFCIQVVAQEPPPLPPEQSLVVPERVGIGGSTHLKLSTVVESVLANDKEIAMSRILVEESILSLKGARGYFDPRFELSAHDSKSTTPISSSLGGAADGRLATKELFADPQFRGSSPWLGTTYKLDFSSARQTSNSTFNTLNPQFLTSLNLNLTQPLWRGLLYDDNRHRVQVAKKNIHLNNEQFRQRVIEIITQAVQAYHELEYAYKSLEIQIEAVRLAEQQDESNRRQVAQGLLAPADVIQTQTQIATYRQNVFSAQTNLTNAENNLKTLMLPDRSDPMWASALVPDRQPQSELSVPSVEEAIKEALSTRPELKQALLSININDLDTRLNREQAKPQIDAYATLGSSGLAGHPLVSSGPNPITQAFVPLIDQINTLSALAGIPPLPPLSFGSGTVPQILVGGYNQSLHALTSGKFTTAVVGVNISLPIRNRTAIAASETSAAEGRRLRLRKQQVEMAVEQDVRNALQAMSATQSGLEAAASARHYAEEQYASEQRQFRAGTSTVFLVLQRQTDLIAARTREARAEADRAEATANLDRALARTLETRKIELK